MASAIPLPLTGGCQCGRTRYEIRAEPLTVYACHCVDCQRQSGSAFALSMIVPRDAVALTAGTPRPWRRHHESGRIIDCLFCADCGARLMHQPHSNPKIAVVKPGTLDNARAFAPVGHIWTRSAQPWFHIAHDAVVYEAQPDSMSGLIAAWQDRSST